MDAYKVNIIDAHLQKMEQDEYYFAQVCGDAGKNINLDRGALELLRNYYATQNVPNEPTKTEGEKEYFVTYRINARFIADVYAKNANVALDRAEGAFVDADFGEAEDVSGSPLKVEDENGTLVWEKPF